jgi:hypothetical protein
VQQQPLGAVYTCDFASESAYDSLYDLLHKMASNIILDFFLKCVHTRLVSEG